MAAAKREDPAVAVDELHWPAKQLRLGHEPHFAAHEHADEEVIHEREVVWSQDHRSARRHTLRSNRAGTKGDHPVQRREHADDTVDPVGLACSSPLVEACKMLGRARILIDLLSHPRELIPVA